MDVRVIGVRFHLCDLLGNVLGKEQLPGVRNMAASVRFDVNVNGPSRVPARINSLELRNSLFVCNLHTAQKARLIRCPAATAAASAARGWAKTTSTALATA